METHRCVLRKGGVVIDENATCWIRVFGMRGGARSWAGRLELSVPRPLQTGGYTIELEDGKEREIAVGRVHWGLHEEPTIEFTGKGSLGWPEGKEK